MSICQREMGERSNQKSHGHFCPALHARLRCLSADGRLHPTIDDEASIALVDFAVLFTQETV